jgi:hypothetical protein
MVADLKRRSEELGKKAEATGANEVHTQCLLIITTVNHAFADQLNCVTYLRRLPVLHYRGDDHLLICYSMFTQC